MPTSEAIVMASAAIAQKGWMLAILWHVFFGGMVIAASTRTISQRNLGWLLVPPFASVSAVAWAAGNPVNGGFFAVLSLTLAAVTSRRRDERIRVAPSPVFVAGLVLLAFGWFYPHFLGTTDWAQYAVAAPLGLLPCPTLSAAIGVVQMFGLYRARWWGGTIAGASAVYGILGVFWLGVTIDVVLLAGAAILWASSMNDESSRSVRASQDECTRTLPGDELISAPIGSLTHGVTIRRPPRDVWPWLVQMGAGSRGGWYSYDCIDNGWRGSANRIIPALQQIEVGMVFPALPGVTDGFALVQFRPERSLVLGWRPKRGEPIMTWAFALGPGDGNTTRLVARARGGAAYRFYGLPWWATRPVVTLIHFVMQRKQLLGIAQRAEQAPVPDGVRASAKVRDAA